MRSWAALLAAVLVAGTIAGCDDDGAEPGASQEATLVLDFQPNAVHAGIYAALGRGYYADEGLDLEIREPSSSTDAPKLLEAGRADLAIVDINDFGIALERGLELRAVAAVVQRPLAAVIAGDREQIVRPRDLEGGTVGVTGLPSDDAVLAAVLAADGADRSSVEPVTIGFESVAALSAGRVDAATAFWNAEGVTLSRLGVPTREFRVDDYGAGAYPELLVVARQSSDDTTTTGFQSALARAYAELGADPDAALADLLEQVPDLEEAEQAAQLRALTAADAFGAGEVEPKRVMDWLAFAGRYGIVDPAAVRARLQTAVAD